MKIISLFFPVLFFSLHQIPLRQTLRQDHSLALGTYRSDKWTDTKSSMPVAWNVYSFRAGIRRGNSYKFPRQLLYLVLLSILKYYLNKEIQQLHLVHNYDSLTIVECRVRILRYSKMDLPLQKKFLEVIYLSNAISGEIIKINKMTIIHGVIKFLYQFVNINPFVFGQF